ncbi:MAG: formate dehydrogenase accessory sulfurtransferase FdhD [Bacteroidetes bacterium]|nr:MAG: formate dehydrogenase accessory sulfurtransferase FdhD [Bacteroidota bacterium]
MEQFQIVKIKGSDKEVVNDVVTEEISLKVEVNKHEIATLLCSKGNFNELSIGYLYSSEIIKSIDDVKTNNIFSLTSNDFVASVETKEKIQFHKLGNKKVKAVGCGDAYSFVKENYKNSNFENTIKVKTTEIADMMRAFQSESETFQKTGGVHSAAIVENNKILVFYEDIGRHNAIDKTIGSLLINKTSFGNKIVLTSGRVSSEILHKVIMCNIPILISRSAPTNKAVKICRNLNITLIGFVRGDKMNIYSGEQRII